MIHRKTFCLIVLLAISGSLSFARQRQQDEWVSLFDGKTLNGWSIHSGFAKYHVEDDAIVGTTVKSEVAIIFDWENRWAIEDAQGPRQEKKNYLESCIRHYQAFWSQGISVDGDRGMTVTAADGDALQIQSRGGGGDGIQIAGNGSGAGINIGAGATGLGMTIDGGATSGEGVQIQSNSGSAGIVVLGATDGVNITGNGGKGNKRIWKH